MAVASSAVSTANTNTSNMFTVDNIVGRLITQNVEGVQKEREIFNLKVAGYGIASVATIVTVALTIFTSSIAMAALSFLIWNVRAACYEAVILTGVNAGVNNGENREEDESEEMLKRLHPAFQTHTNQAIRQYLQIEDANWDFRHSQILNFIPWLNQAPIPAPQAAASIARTGDAGQQSNAAGADAAAAEQIEQNES